MGRTRRMARLVDRLMRRSTTYGLAAATRLTLRDRGPSVEPVDLEWPGYPAPIRLRLGGSDLRTFDQLIVENGYESPFPIDPKVIVDAGANIGLAAVWFAVRHPDAIIVAVEPDADNFALLEHNVAAYPNVHTVRAALWTHEGEVTLTDPGVGSWGFRVGDPSASNTPTGVTVPAIDMPSLLDRFELTHVDLLKVDIEGGEVAVFADASSWIDRVDVIAVELHDQDVAGCARTFYRAAEHFDLDAFWGETTWVARSSAVGSI